jgi:hypothetical protein
VVVHIVGEHVPGRGQDRVLEGDDRFLTRKQPVSRRS